MSISFSPHPPNKIRLIISFFLLCPHPCISAMDKTAPTLSPVVQQDKKTHHASEQEKKSFQWVDIESKIDQMLTRYEEIQRQSSDQEWPVLTCLNIAFKKGDKDPIIAVIFKKLQRLGYLKTTDTQHDQTFTDEMEAALKAFQKDHMVDSDGIYGVNTCLMLNLSPKEKIERIQQSKVRYQHEKTTWHKKCLIINVPTFTMLALNDQNHIDRTHKVIVGMRTRPTPVMHTTLTHVIINPVWGVPSSILFKDKIKHILKDPDYLSTHHYQIFDSDGIEIDQEDINWEKATLDNFPYTLRQKSGPWNALGRIKFSLNNRHAIYLHDTPEIEKFKRSYRALSSGCIRAQDPLDLAQWILHPQNKRYTKDYFEEKIEDEDTIHLPLKKPMDVFITCLPVFINDHGDVVFGSGVCDEEKVSPKK